MIRDVEFGKENFKALAAILKSSSRNAANRDFLQVIHYDNRNKRLVASDGKVMLVVDCWLEELETSKFWTIAGNFLLPAECNLEDIISYEGLLIDPQACVERYSMDYSRLKDKKLRGAINLLSASIASGQVINPSFAPMFDIEFDSFCWKQKESVIRFDGAGVIGLVMPVRELTFKKIEKQ